MVSNLVCLTTGVVASNNVNVYLQFLLKLASSCGGISPIATTQRTNGSYSVLTKRHFEVLFCLKNTNFSTLLWSHTTIPTGIIIT